MKKKNTKTCHDFLNNILRNFIVYNEDDYSKYFFFQLYN